MNEVYRLVTGRERKIKDFTNARYVKEKNQKCKRKKVNEKKNLELYEIGSFPVREFRFFLEYRV